MPLKLTDLPGILRAVRELRGTIEDPPEVLHSSGEPCFPSYVIHSAGDRLLERLCPSGVNRDKKPDIDDAELPLPIIVKLGELWEALGSFAWQNAAAGDRKNEWLLFLDEVVKLLEQVEALASPREPNTSLELISGGFALCGKPHDLTGRPRQMLEALLNSPHRRWTGLELREKIGVNDEAVNYPEQVIRDTAFALRQALKAAMKAGNLPEKNPLPSEGRGTELTYILDLP